MKRWTAGLLIVLAACLPILPILHSPSPSMLKDTDTAFLLHRIREQNAPFSWFAGDWPLQNHFYRPVSTLAFEMDNRLYGDNAAGYAWTNALLCVACVLLLFWFLRELTESPMLSTASTLLFAMWHFDVGPSLHPLFYGGAGVLAVLGLLRHGLKVVYFLPAMLLFSYLPAEVDGMSSLGRMTDWIPARTASVMTVFVLIAMAAYARYERLSADRLAGREPTPLDEPATRTTRPRVEPRGWPAVWVIVSLLAAALALCSYEQAVMLPAALFGTALALRLRRYGVRWGWQAAFWGLLLGYLFLRSRLVPTAPSQYQMQQFRHGAGVYLSLANYLFPAANELPAILSARDLGPAILMTGVVWIPLWLIAANATAFVQSRRKWVFALTGWALSFVVYLPMAWLNPFQHYHYWPMAMRSMFVSTLCWVAYKLAVIAVSPPALQAPARQSPAPGSLAGTISAE